MELLECLDLIEIGVLFSACLSVRSKLRLILPVCIGRFGGDTLVWAMSCISSEGDWMDAHGFGVNRFK
jgi:hypothetical protein